MNTQPLHTIKQASQMADMPPQTLRRLCNSGLIPKIRRNHFGHRVLADWQIDLAKTLHCMKQYGFQNRELRRYAKLFRQGSETTAERQAILDTRKRQLWHEIEERQAAIDFIERQSEFAAMAQP